MNDPWYYRINFNVFKIVRMFNTLRQRPCCMGFSRYFPAVLKLSYSDSSVAIKDSKIKALVEEDFCRLLKKQFNGYFIENLFLNKLEAKVLEYPQLDTKQEVNIIKQHRALAQKLMTGEKESEIAVNELDSKRAVMYLKRHELTGFKISHSKKGFGYLSSEYTYMQEVLALDPSLSKSIGEQEDFGIYLIDKFGNDSQKEQYLLKLTSGESIASFANIEKETIVSSVSNSYITSAVSSDHQIYEISGTKCWVYNANSADLFIVSANVISNEENEAKPTLFLIDKHTPGVEIHEPIKTIGLKNLSICDVTFNNVIVPKSSILGEVSQGNLIIKNVLSQGKLNNGGHCLAAMRKFLNNAIQHCIYNDFFKKDKYETDYYRIKVGHMVSRMYVVESMTYLLTGRLDTHNNPDVFLESLIVKIFASETLQFFVQQALEILGPEFFSNEENLIELSRDSQFYLVCDDTNNYLRSILAFCGLQHSVEYKKHRTFLELLSDVFNRQNALKLIFPPETSLSCQYLAYQYLHKMFYRESLLFEDCIAVLHDSTQFLLKKYRDKAFERSVELRYLADMVINVYAMAATLARASRAYCIAVKLKEIDRLCTATEIRRSFFRVQEMWKLIKTSEKLPEYSEIATSVINSNKFIDLCSVMKKRTTR